MTLNEHYASYRDAVRKGCLEGFSEVSKTIKTARPERWPTIYDFLQSTVGSIRQALEKNDEVSYRNHLREHQRCMIAIFSRMASDAHKGFMGQNSDTPIGLLAALDVINKKGWNWYRFLPSPIRFEKQVWIPRYSPELSEIWSDAKKPYLSATELEIFFKTKPCPKIRDLVLAEKVNTPDPVVLVAIEGSHPKTIPLSKINSGSIRDWTRELFHED